jgi:hypothetical protein
VRKVLVPALTMKEEINKAFYEILYTEDFFYYAGYAHCHELSEIKPKDNVYQYAIVDEHRKLLGYFAYTIQDDAVSNFGLISFDKGNIIVGRDITQKLEELVKTYRRMEWRMIGGNPVKRSYDRFYKKHGGNCVCLHDVCKDLQGNYRDEYIYEIVNSK